MNKKYLSLIVVIYFCLINISAADPGTHFKKVVYIVFENTNYSKAIENKIFKSYADKGASFSNFLAETHPSQPNYIAMIAGSTMNVTNDKNVDLNGSHLGDLLEAKNLTFKSYAENYPGNCFLDKTSGRYARKHVPFLSFKNISQNATRCLYIENGKKFFSDLDKGSLPTFSMYIPDLDDDGHDTGVDVAARWFDQTFGKVLADPAKISDILFVLTFDEATRLPSRNQIYTVLIGNNVKNNTIVSEEHNHISLLKMIEDEFQLGNLGREDATAKSIQGIWK